MSDCISKSMLGNACRCCERSGRSSGLTHEKVNEILETLYRDTVEACAKVVDDLASTEVARSTLEYAAIRIRALLKGGVPDV